MALGCRLRFAAATADGEGRGKHEGDYRAAHWAQAICTAARDVEALSKNVGSST
jgi:hypothetical protein